MKALTIRDTTLRIYLYIQPLISRIECRNTGKIMQSRLLP